MQSQQNADAVGSLTKVAALALPYFIFPAAANRLASTRPPPIRRDFALNFLQIAYESFLPALKRFLWPKRGASVALVLPPCNPGPEPWIVKVAYSYRRIATKAPALE